MRATFPHLNGTVQLEVALDPSQHFAFSLIGLTLSPSLPAKCRRQIERYLNLNGFDR